MKQITAKDADHLLSWRTVCAAIKHGHTLPKAVLSDQFLATQNGTLLVRAASIEGLGSGVKSVSVMPSNGEKGLPSVQGAMIIFDEATGTPRAMIDNALITNWKTVADSLLGAQFLANPDPHSLLIVGSGSVAEKLIDGYQAIFPSIENITIWSRNFDNAQRLASRHQNQTISIKATDNLEGACGSADIISSATFAQTPILNGDWIGPSTHVDLIGAFKPDMREADDNALRKSRIFADSFDTTLDHIGELKIPLETNIIKRSDVLGDLYGLVAQKCGRQNQQEITLFKNGGGAHLDLMVANLIIEAAKV